MEGLITWQQLAFAATILAIGFTAACWVLLKLTEILVRIEQLATKNDVEYAKKDLYERMDRQWNNWMEAHTALGERVKDIEIRLGPVNERGPSQTSR